MSQIIKISDVEISMNHRPYFIADIAANHDGDLERAYKLIELAKEAGADCAKFQNFQAAKIVSKSGFETMTNKMSHQSQWKKSVFDVYKDASIPFDWTEKIKKKCDEVGIEYMTSPYDMESVDYVDPYVNAYKIGSGDITWLEILEYIAQKGKPIILATGAATIEEVDDAVKAITKWNENLILLQCNTNYTGNDENFDFLNINVLNTYKEKYSKIVGLSDHTHGSASVLAAVALGARVIEKHFTDDNLREGPDHKFAMNPLTWKAMVEDANRVFRAMGDGVKKIEENEKDTYIVQRRALYFTGDFEVGHVIEREDLEALRPQKKSGYKPSALQEVLGKPLKRSVNKNAMMVPEDLT